jgi:hypothetical protein
MTMSNMPAARSRDRRADAPAIPDMTLPDFVLARAHLRGAKRALVEADSGRELTYAQLATAVREAGAWLARCRAVSGLNASVDAPGAFRNAHDFIIRKKVFMFVWRFGPVESYRRWRQIGPACACRDRRRTGDRLRPG